MTADSQSLADAERHLLRHTLATLAYRGGKTLRGAPADFGRLKVDDGARTPLEIVAHIGDLLVWALSLAKGAQVWSPAEPGTWLAECDRFFRTIGELDSYLEANAVSPRIAARLFQGPIADSFTHVGQLALLRRMAGSPVRAENYAKAKIAVGHTGADQPPPAAEF